MIPMLAIDFNTQSTYISSITPNYLTLTGKNKYCVGKLPTVFSNALFFSKFKALNLSGMKWNDPNYMPKQETTEKNISSDSVT